MDSGRSFEAAVATGLKYSAVMRALHYAQVDADIKVMMGTDVDDAMWASKSGYEHLVGCLLEKYQLKKVEKGSFRFCGRAVEQPEDCSVFVACRNVGTLPRRSSLSASGAGGRTTTPRQQRLRSCVASLDPSDG